jgi:hypothetical protein
MKDVALNNMTLRVLYDGCCFKATWNYVLV